MPIDQTPGALLPVDLRAVNERLVVTSLREQELAELAEQQRAEVTALVEALGEGVIIVDRAGRIVMMNAGARALAGLGAAPALVSELDALDVRSLDDVELAPQARPLARAMRGERFVDVEVQVRGRGAIPRRVLCSGTSVTVGGDVTLALVLLRDVTERRQLEARLAQAERLATLGTLAAGVAHEVNNPLTYNLANVEFALNSLRDVERALREPEALDSAALRAHVLEVAGALGDARDGAVRVHAIVRALGRAASVDDAERSVLDPTQALESALSFTDGRLRLSARVRRDYRPTPAVSANSDQLAQVFTNLLLNAAQAIGEGTADSHEIVVATSTDGAGRAVVEVRDSGPGMAPEVLARVFDPFFTTKPIGQATGLGLSTSHGIARSLGGELFAESKPGGGSVFRLVLPAARVPPTSPSVPAPPVASRRGRVLVIDDEPALGKALTRLLARDHDVTCLTDGATALARAAEGEAFDIILCDLMMPRMTGMELYARMRVESPDAARVLVIMTGGAFTPESSAFLASFAQPTLRKPLAPAELRALVARYVGHLPPA